MNTFLLLLLLLIKTNAKPILGWVHGKYGLKAGIDNHGSLYHTLYVDVAGLDTYFSDDLSNKALYYDCEAYSNFDLCRDAITATTISNMDVDTQSVAAVTSTSTDNLFEVKARTKTVGNYAPRPLKVLVRLETHPNTFIEEELEMCGIDQVPNANGGCTDCSSWQHNNHPDDLQVCQDNTCTCSSGTPTDVASTNDAALTCTTDGSEDCSACNSGYTISATAAVDSQTCLPNDCIVPTISIGASSWTGANCASDAIDVAHGTTCIITETLGYTCVDPGLCTAGSFAATGICTPNDCAVPTISEGISSWTGDNCASDAIDVAHGTTCIITENIAYNCVDPGLCYAGFFAETGSCASCVYATPGSCKTGCPTDYYQSAGSSASDVVCSACAIGQIHPETASISSTTTCSNCVYATPGSCNTGCPVDYYQSAGTSQADVVCSTCDIGQINPATASVQAVTTCSGCLPGIAGSCTTGCPVNYYQSAGTSAADVVCTTCGDGKNIVAAVVQSSTTSCNDNVCTCSGGTVTVSSGTGSTLCEVDGQEDCSVCDAGYNIQSVGNNHICVENKCSAPTILEFLTNYDLTLATEGSGQILLNQLGSITRNTATTVNYLITCPTDGGPFVVELVCAFDHAGSDCRRAAGVVYGYVKSRTSTVAGCIGRCSRWTGKITAGFSDSAENIEYLTNTQPVCSFLQSKGKMIISATCIDCPVSQARYEMLNDASSGQISTLVDCDTARVDLGLEFGSTLLPHTVASYQSYADAGTLSKLPSGCFMVDGGVNFIIDANGETSTLVKASDSSTQTAGGCGDVSLGRLSGSGNEQITCIVRKDSDLSCSVCTSPQTVVTGICSTPCTGPSTGTVLGDCVNDVWNGCSSPTPDSSGAFYIPSSCSMQSAGVTLTGDLFLQGLLGATHVVNAKTSGIRRHFHIALSDSHTLTLKWLKLTGGSETYGGSIYLEGGSVDIVSSIFLSNSATYGGAIYSSGSITASDSEFESNTATTGGGAINIQHLGSLVATRTIFKENTHTSGSSSNTGGGGLYAFGNSVITLREVTMDSNEAVLNGHQILSNKATEGTPSFTIINTKFIDCASCSSGGLYETSTGTAAGFESLSENECVDGSPCTVAPFTGTCADRIGVDSAKGMLCPDTLTCAANTYFLPVTVALPPSGIVCVAHSASCDAGEYVGTGSSDIDTCTTCTIGETQLSADFSGTSCTACSPGDYSNSPTIACYLCGSLTLGATSVSTGNEHTCVVLYDNTVKCWGAGNNGKLGYDSVDNIGDGTSYVAYGTTYTSIADLPIVAVGNDIIQISAGGYHTCALSLAGTIKCWGDNYYGQLGYDNTVNVGDGLGISMNNLGTVAGITTATQITTGKYHTCVILSDGTAKCWGLGDHGRLGYDSVSYIGKGVSYDAYGVSHTLISNLPAINLGSTATKISAGSMHTCVLLTEGTVKCWGKGSYGALGYDSGLDNGKTTGSMAALGIVIGISGVTDITAGQIHTCVVLTAGTIKCWGDAGNGRLGLGGTGTLGNSAGDMENLNVIVGINTATEVSAGQEHTCAVLSDGTAKCWGYGGYGQLGHDNVDRIGLAVNDVDTLGTVIGIGAVTQISGGAGYTCARLTDSKTKCWGLGSFGNLGYDAVDSKGNSAGEMAALTAVDGLETSLGAPGSVTNTLSNPGASECTECTAGTYSFDPHVACVPHSVVNCPTGQYHTAGTIGADDASCTACPSGTYQSSAGSTATSCTDHTVTATAEAYCHSQRKPYIVGTPTSDYTCGNVCPYGQTAVEGSSSCDRCLPGYGSTDGTNCVSCPETQWNGVDSAFSVACANKACPLGEGVGGSTGEDLTTGDTSNDCTTCAAGYYSDSTAFGQCETCAAGSETDTLTGTSGTTCTKCPAGDYTASSQVACGTCAAGSVTDTLAGTGGTTCTTCGENTYTTSSQVACAAHSTVNCPAGEFFTAGSASANDASCTACPSSSYQSAAASTATACTAHSTSCGAGTYLGIGTATADSCIAHSTSCAAGKYLGTGTATADTCTACPSSSYQSAAGSTATACTAWTTCVAITEVEEVAGSATDDVVCGCSDNHYLLSGTCTACDAGDGNTDGGLCEACGGGTYSVSGGACTVHSTACTAGKYLGTGTATTDTCTTCPSGTYQAVGSYTGTSCGAHTDQSSCGETVIAGTEIADSQCVP